MGITHWSILHSYLDWEEQPADCIWTDIARAEDEGAQAEGSDLEQLRVAVTLFAILVFVLLKSSWDWLYYRISIKHVYFFRCFIVPISRSTSLPLANNKFPAMFLICIIFISPSHSILEVLSTFYLNTSKNVLAQNDYTTGYIESPISTLDKHCRLLLERVHWHCHLVDNLVNPRIYVR
jgi:hypothetical protein